MLNAEGRAAVEAALATVPARVTMDGEEIFAGNLNEARTYFARQVLKVNRESGCLGVMACDRVRKTDANREYVMDCGGGVTVFRLEVF